MFPPAFTPRRIVLDGHMDTPLRMVDEGADLGRRSAAGHADLPRMREGGLDAVFLAAWVDPARVDEGAWDRAETLLRSIHDAARAHPDAAGFATSAAEVRALAAEGRVALLAGIENGQALEGQVENVERAWELGVRYLTLTWMNSNELADAGGGEAVHGGLTPLGREVVAEMERLGMLVDLAHAAPTTFLDVLEAATRPPVVSHAGTEAHGPHHRNLTDEQIRLLAEAGGLIGIAFMPAYLVPGDPDAADVAAVADHVVRAVEVAGVDHVALGSDLDGVPAPPRGIAGVQDLPRVVAELERRGFDEDELDRILGANWLRLLG